MDESQGGWLKVAGEGDPDLEGLLSARRAERLAKGAYSPDDAAYIAKMHLALCPEGLQTSDARLEKLRRLCQLWDVDLRTREISSHRRIIGPLIVGAKRLFYPVLRAFLRDYIRQQRGFNAAVIALLADLSSRPSESPPTGCTVDKG